LKYKNIALSKRWGDVSMHNMPLRVFLILTILTLFNPFSVPAAAEQRTALVIGNSTYNSGPLKNPVNDASDMSVALQKLGFKVILKKNANLETMEEAIEDFGNRLKRGGVGLFYYAGHGVQVNGINYLIPIDAKINKESDIRFKAFDAGRILAEMENANNGLNIVLLDACRDNPFGKSFRSASRGLAIVSSAPAGTFFSYSTGPGQVAQDGEGRNSPYIAALLTSMNEPGIVIEEVFKRVRQRLRKETGQVPWELSSLEGTFYFNPAVAVHEAAAREKGPKHEASPNEFEKKEKTVHLLESYDKKETPSKTADAGGSIQDLPSEPDRGTDIRQKPKKSIKNVASYARTSWSSADVKFHLTGDRGGRRLTVSSTGKSDENNAISRRVFAKKDAEKKAKIALLDELAKPPFSLTESVIVKLFDERDDKDIQYLMDGKHVSVKFEIKLPESI
jgi:hypothetical protein